MESDEKKNWNVEIYNGNTLLGVITVQAPTKEDASNVAIQDINVKIRRSYA
jgi:hypothetical protein